MNSMDRMNLMFTNAGDATDTPIPQQPDIVNREPHAADIAPFRYWFNGQELTSDDTTVGPSDHCA